MYRLNLCDTQIWECDKISQTIKHILLHWTLHDTAHCTIFDHVKHIYAQHNTPYMERELFLFILLHPKHSSIETIHEVRCAVAPCLMGVRM